MHEDLSLILIVVIVCTWNEVPIWFGMVDR